MIWGYSQFEVSNWLADSANIGKEKICDIFNWEKPTGSVVTEVSGPSDSSDRSEGMLVPAGPPVTDSLLPAA